MPPKRKKVGKAEGVLRRTVRKIVKSENGSIASIKLEEITKSSTSKSSNTRCKICKRSFVTSIAYRQHLKRCLLKNPLTVDADRKKNVISCKECSKKFRFEKSYKDHVYNEHSTRPGSVSCSQCSVRCPNQSMLSKHVASVHEREIFECPHCKKPFVRHSHVLRHMEQTGCDGQGVTFFPCEICHAKFSRKDNLMVHLRLQHITKKQFECKQCSYSTATFSKWIIHHQKKHSLTQRHYECDHCGKITSSRAAIAKHLEIHGEKKFACEVCGYSTYTVEVMRRHVLTHVQEKPYKCDLCDTSFIQRVQLQRHLEKHNVLNCKTCNLSFTSKADYLTHSKVHKGSKTLICDIGSCSILKNEYADEEEYKKHLKSHEENKPYECEICHKKFTNETVMRRHVLSHTLERPRRCMYCVAARAYVRGLQLVRHVRKSHPAVFREHLSHVRQVLGVEANVHRVKKSELESILNVLDAETDRILQGYGEGVLYGGMQENYEVQEVEEDPLKIESSPLMSEEELADSLNQLLSQMIDKDTLECFGWPEESVDTVLEKVIEQCGARPADRDKWTRVQCLRENAKHLFLYVIEDKNIARMLDTHTIDQIVKHILAQVSETDDE